MELVEVKKGKTGHGLLIEHDAGHISGDNNIIRQINEDISTNKEFPIPDHFVVSAVFQKYGIKNANGRIYPEKILKREVENYINNKILTKTSIGALDHPACYLPDTKILAESGWKNIQDVNEGECVLTLNVDKVVEVHPVIKRIESKYDGKMIRFKGSSIDLCVTENHKFPVFDDKMEFVGFFTAREMKDGTVPNQENCFFLKTGKWKGVEDDTFELESVCIDNSESLSIPMDVWAEFFGIYLSRGHVDGDDDVIIAVDRDDISDFVMEMLDKFPAGYSYEKTELNHRFKISNPLLANYLKGIGCWEKRCIPLEMKRQCSKTLGILYDWFMMGIRNYDGDCQTDMDEAYSSSERLTLDINEIQFKAGHSGRFREEDEIGEWYFSCEIPTDAVKIGRIEITEEDYSGMVYCVEVENHDVYVMDDGGNCVWSGNSTTLSGHDVSHKILNLEWNGKTLVGELELQLSRGFKKYGILSTSGDYVANLLISDIMVGVSSRAVGSVENVLGALMVGDDLELIGWDVVCEPSTPNAWIKGSRQELQPFIEGDATRVGKAPVNEKIEKVRKILI